MPIFAIFLLVMATLFLPLAGRANQPHPPASAAPVRTPIRTRAELLHYLKVTPAAESPLSLLPPGARRRFVDGLVWGAKGAGSIPLADLQQYLTNAQALRVLSLIDARDVAAAIQGRAKPLTAAERDASETPLEHNFDKLYWAQIKGLKAGGSGVAANIPTLYDRLLAPYQQREALAKLDDSDLGLLFRAANLAAGIAYPPRYLDDMRLDLEALNQRGAAATWQVSGLHGNLVAAHRFTDANQLARQYEFAGIAPLPPLHATANVHDGEPTVLVMEPDGKSILHKPIDMQVPLQIVVVAGCHFSEATARAIEGIPQLDKLFHAHAIWLANESEPLPDVLQWNREFPSQIMNVAWRDSQWSMLDSWNMPTFYVFRHGKLVGQWAGWNGMQDLTAHLRKYDLLR